VGGFAEDMSYSEDLEWLFRVICHQRQGLLPWQIEGIDRILVYYRASPAGLSGTLGFAISDGVRLGYID